MSKPTLHIRLFGSLELVWSGEALPVPSSPKACSLLAYLILHHNRPIPRDRLTGIFWPERPDARARRALSNALWQIRSALGPVAQRLTTERDTIVFKMQAGDRLDVVEFEERVNKYADGEIDVAPLPNISDLYRADFLEACYDDWVLVERERLRELYLRALEYLIEMYKQRGEFEEALTCAQELVAADPLREVAHRELMRLYHLLGRPRAALEQFDRLHEFLAEELGEPPSMASLALRQEIATALDEVKRPHLPVPPPPPPLLQGLAHLSFVGRTSERAALVEALQNALQGHGGLALIEGNVGVGKTRLVGEIAAGARWRGFQVGLGKGDPVVTSAPYQLLRDAITPLLTPLRVAQLAGLVEPLWLGVVAPLFPPLATQLPDLPTPAPLGPLEEKRRLWEGLSRCLVGLTSIAPLLLALEDIHWADDAALAALPHLAQRLSTHRALLVLAYRPSEAHQRAVVWEALDAIDRAQPPLHIQLSSFEQAEAVAFVRRALGVGEDAQAMAFVQRLQEEIGGNALFLVETLKALLEQGDLAPVSGPSSIGGPMGWRFPTEDLPLPIPTSVQELIGERVRRLSPGLQSLLEMVAVLGDEADFPVISLTSDGKVTTLTERLRSLTRQGFLTEIETGYRFEHNLVRGVVYRAIPPQRRAMLHRRVGEALEELHPERIETLAFHFNQSGTEHKALTYSLQASERAMAVYDHKRALIHLEKALALVGDEATRWDVLARREEALNGLSRRKAQAETLDEMLQLAKTLDDPARLAHTYHRLGWREVLSGETAQALSLLDEAIALARGIGEHNLLGNCLISAARAWWRIGDVQRCQTAIKEALSLFQETSDREAEVRARNMLGNLHLGLTGNYAQALAYFERNLERAQELGDAHREAAARGNIGITCTLLGRYQRSQEALGAAAQVMAEVGDRHWQGIILHWQGANHRALGDLAQAEAAAAQSLAICREVNNRNFEIAALELLGKVALDRGAPEEASIHFEQAAAVAQANQQRMDRALNRSHMALALLRLGRVEEARRLSEEAIAEMEGLGGQLSRMKDVYFERYQIIAACEGAEAARPHLESAHRHLMDMAANIQEPDLRRSFLEDVIENRDILTAHRLGSPPTPPRRLTVRLPHAAAPTGRPLHEEEYIEVTWTVAAPEDEEIDGGVERRRHRILRLLRQAAEQSAAPTLAGLAEALGVSERTIKRDLAALRAEGHDVRTRGSRN